MARPQSNWICAYFRQTNPESSSELECKRCKRVFKYSSRNGPTNLLRHLDKAHHIDPHTSSERDENADTQERLTGEIYKENLAVPNYAIPPKSPIELQSPLHSSPQIMAGPNLLQLTENQQSLSLRLERVERSMTRLEQRLMISLNSQRGNGLEYPFEIVPFNSGLLPQEMERMNLPLLINCNVLFQCSSQMLDIYMSGYGSSCQGLSKRDKVVQVGVFIGCLNVERFLKGCNF